MANSVVFFLFKAEVNWHATEFGAFWVDCNDNSGDDDSEAVALTNSLAYSHEEGEVGHEAELTPETQIRLTRRTALALVIESEHFCVHHCMTNCLDAREADYEASLQLDKKASRNSLVLSILAHFSSSHWCRN